MKLNQPDQAVIINRQVYRAWRIGIANIRLNEHARDRAYDVEILGIVRAIIGDIRRSSIGLSE